MFTRAIVKGCPGWGSLSCLSQSFYEVNKEANKKETSEQAIYDLYLWQLPHPICRDFKTLTTDNKSPCMIFRSSFIPWEDFIEFGQLVAGEFYINRTK